MSKQLRDRIDEYRVRMVANMPGVELKQSDVIRSLITYALDDMEMKRKLTKK